MRTSHETSDALAPRSQDLELAAAPGRWPCFPILPLVSRENGNDGWPDVGVIAFFPEFGVQPTVYLAVVGDFGSLHELIQFPYKRYDTIEDLLSEWMVD